MASKKKFEESKVFSFRLPLGAAALWDAKINRSGYNRSEFFRRAVEGNRTEVFARPVASANAKRAVFLLAKASNNVNQISHRLNADNQAGKVSSSTYKLILNQLELLNNFLVSQAEKVSK